MAQPPPPPYPYPIQGASGPGVNFPKNPWGEPKPTARYQYRGKRLNTVTGEYEMVTDKKVVVEDLQEIITVLEDALCGNSEKRDDASYFLREAIEMLESIPDE